MRYTTVIDLREYPQAYRSQSVRLLYLHMCLVAGYHETDRDVVSTSLRRLATSAGLTLSATRHALKVLESVGLLKRTSQGLLVVKWVQSEQVAVRPSAKAVKPDRGLSESLRRADAAQEEYARRVEAAVKQCTVEELQQWAQELDEGRSLRHRGVQLNANKRNVQWLNEVIKRR